jgi:hypothetical protein
MQRDVAGALGNDREEFTSIFTKDGRYGALSSRVTSWRVTYASKDTRSGTHKPFLDGIFIVRHDSWRIMLLDVAEKLIDKCS